MGSGIALSKHAQGPMSAGFFGSFSEAESTYDSEADVKMNRRNYPLIPPEHPYSDGGVRPSAFFHESQSGGPNQAYQTHYPALRTGIAGRTAGGAGGWHQNGNGQWIQDYNSHVGERELQRHKSAAWFDSGVTQFDGYGRPRMPDPGSVQFMTSWTERSVNTTLTCQASGCRASSMLQAFNPETEEASNCHFSLHLHPTDFDDQYSGERLTFIAVNGVTVNTDCFPMVSGCNESTQAPLFSCLNQLPLENIIDSTGTLTVEAQISDVVDECPYEGNLLSGVPMVTCLVRDRPAAISSTPLGAIAPPLPVAPTQGPVSNLEVYVTSPLKCLTRGCSAETQLTLNRTAVNFSQCLLNVKIYQTDFDNEADTFEGLDFLSVDGQNVLYNVTPGGNPCRSTWANGRSMSLAEIETNVLPNFDVTAAAEDGLISVSTRISRYVDECAHDGYLLNGLVEVNCTVMEI
jgi:hypothetical protein